MNNCVRAFKNLDKYKPRVDNKVQQYFNPEVSLSNSEQVYNDNWLSEYLNSPSSSPAFKGWESSKIQGLIKSGLGGDVVEFKRPKEKEEERVCQKVEVRKRKQNGKQLKLINLNNKFEVEVEFLGCEEQLDEFQSMLGKSFQELEEEYGKYVESYEAGFLIKEQFLQQKSKYLLCLGLFEEFVSSNDTETVVNKLREEKKGKTFEIFLKGEKKGIIKDDSCDNKISEERLLEVNRMVESFKDPQGGKNVMINTVETERKMKVFLSSTFIDLQEERAHLTKEVFPRLKTKCQKKGIGFGEVDLRWGITEDQAQSGQIIDLCFQQIDKCRPYFVNILGDRYGWCPNEITKEISEKYSFLKEGPNTKSITELEVEYGAFQSNNKSSSLFYFKNIENKSNDDFEKLEDLKKRIIQKGFKYRNYSTVDQLGQFIQSDLESLINQISGNSNNDNKKEEDEENVLHSSFLIQNSDLCIFTKDYSDQLSSNRYLIVEGETGTGKTTILSTYIRNQENSMKSKYDNNNNSSLFYHFSCVSSSSCSYSNFLFRFLSFLKKKFNFKEEIRSDVKDRSHQLKNWIRSKLISGTEITVVVDGFDQLQEESGEKREKSNKTETVSTVGNRLDWVPDDCSSMSNFRIYLSVQKREMIDSIISKSKNQQKNQKSTSNQIIWKTIEVKGLSTQQKLFLVPLYLNLFGKSLSPSQLRSFIEFHNANISTLLQDSNLDTFNYSTTTSSPSTHEEKEKERKVKERTLGPIGVGSNGLFIRTVLDELRAVSDFDSLNETIEYYLGSVSLKHLFQKIFNRLEKESKLGREFVREIFGLVYSSEKGLERHDLLHIIESGTLVDIISLEEKSGGIAGGGVLQERNTNGEVLLFPNENQSIRSLIRDNYFPTPSHERKYRTRIAYYLEQKFEQQLNEEEGMNRPEGRELSINSKRMLNEICLQYYHLNSYFHLSKFLTKHWEVFHSLYNKTSKYLLKEFWNSLSEEYHIGQAYIGLANQFSELDPLVRAFRYSRIAKFLREMTYYSESEYLYYEALKIYEEYQMNNQNLFAKALYRIAQMYWNQGKLEEAEVKCKKALEIWRRSHENNQLLIAKALCGLGEINTFQKNYQEALEFLQESFKIRVKKLGRTHHLISRLLQDIAIIKDSQGEFQSSINMHMEAIVTIIRCEGEHPKLAVSFENLGVSNYLAQRYKEAKSSLEISLLLYLQYHGSLYPGTGSVCQWLGSCCNYLGEFSNSQEYKQLSEVISFRLKQERGVEIVERIVEF